MFRKNLYLSRTRVAIKHNLSVLSVILSNFVWIDGTYATLYLL